MFLLYWNVQSAILGMHSIVSRPMVVGGNIVPRPMMYIALTYDHRLIDGREAVFFLRRIKDVVEDPRRLLLDVWKSDGAPFNLLLSLLSWMNTPEFESGWNKCTNIQSFAVSLNLFFQWGIIIMYPRIWNQILSQYDILETNPVYFCYCNGAW